MDALLQPNTGLMVWTVVTFLLLVLVLTKAAWKPILNGLESRESKIKSDLDRAEKSQKEAEILKSQFESQLAQAQKTIQDMISKAKSDGEQARAQLVAAAREESDRILEKGRKDLGSETDRLKDELRQEVAGVAVTMAEKILQRSVDPKVQEQILKDSLKEIAEVKR